MKLIKPLVLGASLFFSATTLSSCGSSHGAITDKTDPFTGNHIVGRSDHFTCSMFIWYYSLNKVNNKIEFIINPATLGAHLEDMPAGTTLSFLLEDGSIFNLKLDESAKPVYTTSQGTGATSWKCVYQLTDKQLKTLAQSPIKTIKIDFSAFLSQSSDPRRKQSLRFQNIAKDLLSIK